MAELRLVLALELVLELMQVLVSALVWELELALESGSVGSMLWATCFSDMQVAELGLAMALEVLGLHELCQELGHKYHPRPVQPL